MKIELIGSPQIVLNNSESKHNYFAWPSIARLRNGRIAVASSGYRLQHVCPFGKAVMAISEDEGAHYTRPMPVIDTVLDDRDTGLTPFGKSGLILTSFNNTLAFQRRYFDKESYAGKYLDTVSMEEQDKALGATFRISHDNGVTFGPIYHSPVTSPHGPLETRDGRIIWVGRTFRKDHLPADDDCVLAYTVNTDDGSMEYLGKIDNIDPSLLSCEPHAIELPNGDILCHIRVQRHGANPVFTIYQSVSSDGGRTWSKPVPILPENGGAPAHLMQHSSGLLISVYGYRCPPYGIKAMFSKDRGKTWDTDHILYENPLTDDIGYPASIELCDGSILTVFYAHPEQGESAVILQQKWRITE